MYLADKLLRMKIFLSISLVLVFMLSSCGVLNDTASIDSAQDINIANKEARKTMVTDEEARTLTGWIAKWACSEQFMSPYRRVDQFVADDLYPYLQQPLRSNVRGMLNVTVDTNEKSITAHLGSVSTTALYRETMGCTLVLNRSVAELQAEHAPVALPDPNRGDRVWPDGSKVNLTDLPEGINRIALENAIDFAFAPTEKEGIDLNTRAVVIVYKGRIIGERYAPDFDKNMMPYGASMSKSATSAIVGLRVKDGELNLSDNRLLPEWQGAEEPRSKITLDQLLRMSSGLAFDIDPDKPNIDSHKMLYAAPDMAAYAAQFTLEAQPDTKYRYSNGTSNILMKILRHSFNGDDQAYWAYPRKRLFDKLGMRSAIFETDTSGTFVGSSYLRATPRDWARLGLLYVRKGVWNGEHLWPKDWVDYSTTPSSTLLDSAGTDREPNSYGAQIWLWRPFEVNKPASHFYMGGDGGQYVTMIPKQDLVVVRMGWHPSYKLFDRAGFIQRVVKALLNNSAEARTT